MQTLTLREKINVGGKEFYHYSLGGKWFAKEFVVIDDVHYYDTIRQAEER